MGTHFVEMREVCCSNENTFFSVLDCFRVFYEFRALFSFPLFLSLVEFLCFYWPVDLFDEDSFSQFDEESSCQFNIAVLDS